MMNLTFELNLKITGSSLDEIDAGLTQAAGERLQARIRERSGQMAAISFPQETSTALAQSANVAVDRERKPRQPRATKEGVDNGKIEETKENKSQEVQNEAKSAEVVSAPAATKDAAIEAVGRVNAKFGTTSSAAGIEKVKECLAKFSAPSVSKMDPAKYGEFIAHCDSVCA